MERFENVAVMLPYVAYSAATILSLGANEIIMHPYSNLGPVDPLLTTSHTTASGTTEKLSFNPEDIVNYIECVRGRIVLIR